MLDVQVLSVFWIVAFLLAFTIGYLLAVWEHGGVSLPRAILTWFVGALIMLATYARVVAAKPFEVEDFLLLAFVIVHGWAADDSVTAFITFVSGRKSARGGH